jgi:serine/threonine protein kinase
MALPDDFLMSERAAGAEPSGECTPGPEGGVAFREIEAGRRVFSRYRLRHLLGRGRMGMVWLAVDETLSQEVAIKFLPARVVHDAGAMEEVRRAAKHAEALDHPRIVRVYGLVEDAAEGLSAISMEYVAGGNVCQRRAGRPRGTCTLEEIVPLLKQLCAALDYAHFGARLVHGDVKPAHLLLDARGQLKVADFGIARSLAECMSRASGGQMVAGAPCYLSPQLARGDKPVPSDDVYAVGATLYDLLTGQPPFHSGDAHDRLLSEIPVKVNPRRRELGIGESPVPALWEQTIASCLGKQPIARPRSAGEILYRLGLATRCEGG